MNKSKTLKHFTSALAVGIFLFLAFGSDDDNDGSSSSSEQTTSSSQTYVEIGQPLKTKYFEVTINEVAIQSRVNTGNQFSDLKPEEGTSYLILNTTFKNTDNESRMLMDGEVLINYNGKEYKFDKSETLMLEGWGIMLDQINPLTTKTTNLVYKIPTEIKGATYYRPGRAGKNDLILIGNIE